MQHQSIPASLRFSARPHTNIAAAARHYDRLLVATLRGRAMTDDEREHYLAARAAYVRCSVGIGRRLRVEAREFVANSENFRECVRVRGTRRPRERRSTSARVRVERDDGGGDLPPQGRRSSARSSTRRAAR